MNFVYVVMGVLTNSDDAPEIVETWDDKVAAEERANFYNEKVQKSHYYGQAYNIYEYYVETVAVLSKKEEK